MKIKKAVYVSLIRLLLAGKYQEANILVGHIRLLQAIYNTKGPRLAFPKLDNNRTFTSYLRYVKKVLDF